MVKAHDPFLGKLTSEGTGDGNKHHAALDINNRPMLQVLLESGSLQPQPQLAVRVHMKDPGLCFIRDVVSILPGFQGDYLPPTRAVLCCPDCRYHPSASSQDDELS